MINKVYFDNVITLMSKVKCSTVRILLYIFTV